MLAQAHVMGRMIPSARWPTDDVLLTTHHLLCCAAGCKAWIRSLEEQELQHAALARQHEQLQQQHAAAQAELAAARAGWQQQQTGHELLSLELASLKEERDVLLRSSVQPYIDAAAAAAEAALP